MDRKVRSIHPQRLTGDLVVYRVVNSADRCHEDFVRSFMSRLALGNPPRSWTPEGEYPELARGISVFTTAEAAKGVALQAKRRGRGFGDFVAELRLSGAMGVDFAVWGSRGHLTIWGEPLILARAAADIVRIDG